MKRGELPLPALLCCFAAFAAKLVQHIAALLFREVIETTHAVLLSQLLVELGQRYALLPAPVKHIGNGFCGNQEHRQVGDSLNVFDMLTNFPAIQLTALASDHINGSLEAETFKIINGIAAEIAW